MSLQQAFEAGQTRNTTSYSLFLAPGDYIGAPNINVNFPRVFTSLERWADPPTNETGEVRLDGRNDFEYCVSALGDLNITDITITNCTVPVYHYLSVEVTHTLTLRRVTLHANTFAVGLNGGVLRMSDATITGGAIYSTSEVASSVYLSNCTFTNARLDSLIYNAEKAPAYAELENCYFHDGAGWRFDMGGGEIYLRNCEFRGAVPPNDTAGASLYASGRSVTLENVTFSAGLSNRYAVLIEDTGSVSMTGVTVDESFPTGLAVEAGDAHFESCTVKSTELGLDVSVASLRVKESTFHGNTIKSMAIAYLDLPMSIHISNSTFDASGPVQLDKYTPADRAFNLTAVVEDCEFHELFGSAIVATYGNWTIDNVMAEPLVPVNGTIPALITMISDPLRREGSLALTNCQLTGKNSDRRGLVVTGLLNVTLTNCDFTAHSAGVGGAVYINDTQSVTVDNCQFQNNTAKDMGGAMYLQVTNYHQNNGSMGGNRAPEGGDLYLFATSNSSYSIMGTTFQNSDNAIAIAGATANLTVDSLVFNSLQDEAVTCYPTGNAVQSVIFDTEDALGPPDTAANWVSNCMVVNGPLPKESDLGVILGIVAVFVFLCGAVSCTLIVEQIKARRSAKRDGYSELSGL